MGIKSENNFFKALFLGFIWFFIKRMYSEGAILFIISFCTTILIFSVSLPAFADLNLEVFVWLPLFFVPNFVFAFFADTRLEKKSGELAENSSQKHSKVLNVGSIMFSAILYFAMLLLALPFFVFGWNAKAKFDRQRNPLMGKTFQSVCEGELFTKIIFLSDKKAKFVFHEFWPEDSDNGGEVTYSSTVDYKVDGNKILIERVGIKYVFSYSELKDYPSSAKGLQLYR